MMMFPQAERGFHQDPWVYFDAYKKSGEGQAVKRPSIDEFSHVTDETKRKDAALVEKKQSKPHLREQRETGADSFAFENFLTAKAIEHGWLGGEVSATTDYDDWVSGADAVVEWASEDGEPLRLAVDFTAAKRESVFFSKADKLEGDVVVKYLRSKVEHGKEMRARIPIVILGFDKTVFEHVALSGEEIGPQHPMKRLLLEQASAQIKMQIRLTIERGFSSSRAHRSKKLDVELKNQILGVTDETPGEEFIRLYRSLDKQALDEIFHPKYQERIGRLFRLDVKVEEELEAARESIPLSLVWEQLAQSSRTHNILSK